MSSMVGYSIRLENCTSRNTVSPLRLPTNLTSHTDACPIHFQRLNFVTNGIALRMLESGSGGNGGKSTAFDEITVRLQCPFPPSFLILR